MDSTITPLHAVILGHDAILAARPADPVQLARACHLLGFDLVVPVTWGEELVATHAAERLKALGEMAAVHVACPFVAERLRSNGVGGSAAAIRTVPAAVACARYVRAMLPGRAVEVTFVGRCPGAASPEIDAHRLPDVLLSALIDAGIDVLSQPRLLDERVPAERARYASLPGGAPAPEWLAAVAGATLVEAAPVTVEAVARAQAGRAVLMDLARACGCTCARDRAAVLRSEPARSQAPVVRSPRLPVGDAEPQAPVEREVPPLVSIEPAILPSRDPRPDHDRRVAFAERGFSDVDAEPPERLTHLLSTVVEPWAKAPPD